MRVRPTFNPFPFQDCLRYILYLLKNTNFTNHCHGNQGLPHLLDRYRVQGLRPHGQISVFPHLYGAFDLLLVDGVSETERVDPHRLFTTKEP